MLAILSLMLLDPTQTPPPEACVERPALCRALQEYDLQADGRSVIVQGGVLVPWLDDDDLTLFVGESVVLDVEAPKPAVISFGRADAVLDDAMTRTLTQAVAGTGDELPREHTGEHLVLDGPSTRLRLSFRQALGAEDMLLTVENGYEGMLTYEAAMMIIGEQGGQWVRTSVCTVPPGIYTLEHWPHAIVALSLSNIRVGPKGEVGEVVCR